MKKLVIAALAVIVLAACTKNEETYSIDEPQKAVLALKSSQTKSYNGLDNAVNSRTPELIDITITDEAGNKTKVKSDQVLSLAPGTYSAYAMYYDKTDCGRQDFLNHSVITLRNPFVKVEEEFVITADHTEYELSGYFDCFGLIANAKSVKGYRIGDVELATYTECGYIGTFIRGYHFKELVVTVEYTDGSEKDILLYAVGSREDGFLVEAGCCYLVTGFVGGDTSELEEVNTSGYAVNGWIFKVIIAGINGGGSTSDGRDADKGPKADQTGGGSGGGCTKEGYGVY